MKKLIVGIGNPGGKYAYNRHNVGYTVLDKLAQELRFKNYDLRKDLESYIINHTSFILAKPQTFMNNSGIAVKKLLSYYSLPAPSLCVVHDDLDLALGTWKIQYQKGPKIHKGLLSIEQQIGTKNFWRVRIGVDNRKPGNRVLGEKYVLEDFDRGERELLDKVIKEIVEELSSKIIN